MDLYTLAKGREMAPQDLSFGLRHPSKEKREHSKTLQPREIYVCAQKSLRLSAHAATREGPDYVCTCCHCLTYRKTVEFKDEQVPYSLYYLRVLM